MIFGGIITKLAVTAMGKDLDSNVSPVFGRCPYNILVLIEDGEFKDVQAIDNPVKNEKGAGNLAAQIMENIEIEALISGDMGPVAFHILRNAGIKLYKTGAFKVRQNLKLYLEGRLNEIKSHSSGYPQ